MILHYLSTKLTSFQQLPTQVCPALIMLPGMLLNFTQAFSLSTYNNVDCPIPGTRNRGKRTPVTFVLRCTCCRQDQSARATQHEKALDISHVLLWSRRHLVRYVIELMWRRLSRAPRVCLVHASNFEKNMNGLDIQEFLYENSNWTIENGLSYTNIIV